MKTLPLYVVLAVLSQGVLAVEKPIGLPDSLWDEKAAITNQKSLENSKKKCGHIQNVSKEMDCWERERIKYSMSHPIRGTRFYNDQVYGKLNLADARTKLKELEKLHKLSMKHGGAYAFSGRGVLNNRLLQNEVWYLQERITKLAKDPTLADQAEQMGYKKMADDIRKLTGE
jgi:hypothetical protein